MAAQAEPRVQDTFKFQWPCISDIRSEKFQTQFKRAQSSTNWDQLLNLARSTRSVDCRWEDKVGFGGVHLVRVVTFIDGVQWLARVTMSEIYEESEKGFRMLWTDDDVKWMQSEIDTMAFIRTRSEIPVPKVFTYDVSKDNTVGMPYMFLELIYGNSLRDLSVDIPDLYRQKVFEAIARVHVSSFCRVC